MIVGLDGSRASEVVLPYVRAFLNRGARVTLALIPDAEGEGELLTAYGHRLLESLRPDGVPDVVTEGSGPERSLIHLAESGGADLGVIGSHGQGSLERAKAADLGSVTSLLLRKLACPLLVVPSAPQDP